MKIGIIGAGHIGGTLTRRLTAVGNDVAVANSRGPDTLRDLATETGAMAVTAKEAAAGSDVIIVAIPEKNIRELPKDLFAQTAASTVVVDTGNYYPQRDGRIDAIENGMPESVWVSERLGRPVVKAFNTIHAQHLLERGKPAGARGRLAIPVAGDDARAKAIVMRLIDQIGFDAVDAGGLDESWRQQPGTPVYGAEEGEAGVREALAAAHRERPPQFRAKV